MKPKFSIRKDEKLMIGEKYFSNGHWMLGREACCSSFAPKALAPLLNKMHGRYDFGDNTPTKFDESIFEAVIPKREGYREISPAPIGVTFKNETEIVAYKYRVEATSGQEEFEISIAHRYVPLLKMGMPFAKNADSPILILDSDSLNGELIGVIMPVRL